MTTRFLLLDGIFCLRIPGTFSRFRFYIETTVQKSVSPASQLASKCLTFLNKQPRETIVLKKNWCFRSKRIC